MTSRRSGSRGFVSQNPLDSSRALSRDKFPVIGSLPSWNREGPPDLFAYGPATSFFFFSLLSPAQGPYPPPSLSRQSRPPSDMDAAEDRYRAPFFPWVQAGALWVNWFLVCQLPPDGLIALAAYVGVAVLHYLCYGWRHSVGNCSGWSLLLDAAEASKADGGTTVFAGMDAHHGLGGVSVEDGVDAPLLGKAASGDVDGEGSDQVTILDGGEGSPDSVGMMPAPHASRTPERSSAREKLVRRRSSECIR